MGSINNGNTSSSAYNAMTQAQTKYVQDQQKVAAGQLDPSALTSDWDSYLKAAQAWQGGSASSSTILPINEDSTNIPSFSLSSSDSTSSLTTQDRSVTNSGTTTGGTDSTSSTTLSTGSAGGSGAMSILGGSSTVSGNYPGLYSGYIPGIEAASKATGVSANILAGVIATESRGFGNLSNPMQVNNDQGSMNANIMEGAKELVQHADTMDQKYGKYDLGLTLRAYNSGDNGVDPNDLSALPAGTGQPYYVDQVESNIKALETGSGTITQ